MRSCFNSTAFQLLQDCAQQKRGERLGSTVVLWLWYLGRCCVDTAVSDSETSLLVSFISSFETISAMSLVSACRGAGAGVGNACVFFRRLGTPQSCRRRVLSSSSAFKDEKLRDLLFQRDFNVPSFGGALVASTPFNLSVEPVGTQDYPNLDRAFVTARSKVGSAHVKDKIKVKTSQEDNVLRVEPEKIEGVDSSSVKVSAQLPMVHNVDITGKCGH